MVNMETNTATEIKIIDAATEIFLSKGKDGARMQEIADLAGINKALLHYYFRSKEQLFAKVFQREIAIVVSNLFDAVAQQENLRDFLLEFISRYIDNILARQNLIRFVLWESKGNNESLLMEVRRQLEARGFKLNPIIQRLELAIQQGEIRPVDPVQVVLSMMPIIIGPILGNFMVPTSNLNSDFMDQRKQHIYDMIWNYIRPAEGE